MYGEFTTEMEELIRPYVDGKLVVDLGAGDLTKTRRLAALGAKVIAVDKEEMPVRGNEPFEVIETTFTGFAALKIQHVPFAPAPRADLNNASSSDDHGDHRRVAQRTG